MQNAPAMERPGDRGPTPHSTPGNRLDQYAALPQIKEELAALMMTAALLLGEQIGIFLIEADCALKYVDDEASRHVRAGRRAASGKMI